MEKEDTGKYLAAAKHDNGSIDWNAIHARLEQVNSAINREWSPSEEDVKRILKSRAEKIARMKEYKKETASHLYIVEFLLGEEKYGIEVPYLQEVFPLKQLTPLPGTPDFILGIINVRGRIIPIMDIKKFFDIPDKGITDLNRVLIIRKDDIETGILADKIIEVKAVISEELQPPMITLTGIRSDYLIGITSERLIVLDIARIMDDPAIIINKELHTGGRI
jgi:purine-binding chemotaxis protein CheW